MIAGMFARSVFAALLIAAPSLAQSPAPVFPGHDWAQTSPAAAGWGLKRMKEAADYATEIGATAVMFIQHGAIVAAGGDLAARTELHSCRKSFLSALIGNAVARGQMHLDDT